MDVVTNRIIQLVLYCNGIVIFMLLSGYPAMGAALQATGRDIVYSCSWPAYLPPDESTKPFDKFIAAGCNLWRNWYAHIGHVDKHLCSRTHTHTRSNSFFFLSFSVSVYLYILFAWCV